ncbi:MAG: phosphatidylglycerophosphatase A [Gammaproteobacteria bacterium]|nr:phosphatidylglycerophosphatase A [Gammaproteobacteria bacterium]
MKRLHLADLWSHPANLFALGFGSGLAPRAPGTFGTLAALPPYLFWLQGLSLPWFLAVIVLSFLLGIWLCDVTARDLGVHDHPGIVWDEFVGLWISCIALPTGWPWLLAAFVLFRFFDILKPWPIRWLDRKVPGGLGIMVDDLLAGLFALAVIQLAAVWL